MFSRVTSFLTASWSKGFVNRSAILSDDGIYSNFTWFSVFFDEVIFDIYVFCSAVIFVIYSIWNRSYIVTMNYYRLVNRKAYFVKELAKPYGLGHCSGKCHVFCLDCWWYHGLLPFTLPRWWTTCNNEDISFHWLPWLFTPSKIWVNITNGI